jgi:hypothetical protein
LRGEIESDRAEEFDNRGKAFPRLGERLIRACETMSKPRSERNVISSR